MTNSERRVQRVRKALDPPGEARDDGWIISAIAERMGFDWGQPSAEEAWDELRSLSPMHRGMSYERLEALGGIQWPCPDEESTGLAVPARAAVGRAARGRARRRSRRSSTSRPTRRSTPSTRSA